MSSPHFSSGIVERAKRERAWKSSLASKARRGAWSDFYARSRLARSTYPEEKWGLLVVYLRFGDLITLFSRNRNKFEFKRNWISHEQQFVNNTVKFVLKVFHQSKAVKEVVGDSARLVFVVVFAHRRWCTHFSGHTQQDAYAQTHYKRKNKNLKYYEMEVKQIIDCDHRISYSIFITSVGFLGKAFSFFSIVVAHIDKWKKKGFFYEVITSWFSVVQ